MFYHKIWEENIKKSNCVELLQLNHFAQKTEAKKVADVRITILMQNQKFHSGCYISSYVMGLRMVTYE